MTDASQPDTGLSDDELLRYSRHILHPGIDYEGQLALKQGRVAIVGAGGLGCPAAMYLAASGVGSLTIFDDDSVEASNLQRQIGFTSVDIGQAKAEALCARLSALNPHIRVQSVVSRFTEATGAPEDFDLVLDCSDNFATRAGVNKFCVSRRVPLVSGAAIRNEGQLCVFDSRVEGSACYHCLYGDLDESGGAANCAESGVLSPLVGVIGALQAVEATKVLFGRHQDSLGKLLLYDATGVLFRTLRFSQDPECAVCGNTPSPRP
ncbi:molybdopterin-synthase adenylyltransferase MoeB [Allohahella marinimesophila]|uniref:Molybdopterin-synthase adenylyltransferase MoeB n=1 Tax=Allohahella marinimesophila TaxID=1054972 RepID=A0ABP7Q4B3_9GAMM